MPQYQYPGVYVEEVATETNPIPGVSTSVPASIDPMRLEALVAAMRELGIPRSPDVNESDPGATLVELFSWLAEQLQYREVAVPERLRESALRAVAALSAPCLARMKEGEPLQRPDFFSGRLLDSASLRMEQDYFREKLRRHNLAAHGYGIVEGLGVSVDSTSDPGGSRIIVEPGAAFEPRGEALALPRGAALAAPENGAEIYVALCFWEHPCPDTAAPANGHPRCGCIEEACLVGLKTQPSFPWLALARLTRTAGNWSVDPTFQPPRVRAATSERPG